MSIRTGEPALGTVHWMNPKSTRAPRMMQSAIQHNHNPFHLFQGTHFSGQWSSGTYPKPSYTKVNLNVEAPFRFCGLAPSLNIHGFSELTFDMPLHVAPSRGKQLFFFSGGVFPFDGNTNVAYLSWHISTKKKGPQLNLWRVFCQILGGCFGAYLSRLVKRQTKWEGNLFCVPYLTHLLCRVSRSPKRRCIFLSATHMIVIIRFEWDGVDRAMCPRVNLAAFAPLYAWLPVCKQAEMGFMARSPVMAI